MNSKFSIYLGMGAILLTGVLGCSDIGSQGKRGVVPNTPSGKEKPGQPSLSGKTSKEVLDIKYKKANLLCRVWIQNSSDIDPSIAPQGEASIALSDEKLLETPLSFEGDRLGFLLTSNFKVKSFEISSYTYEDKSQKPVVKEYSPLIKISHDATLRVSFEGGESLKMDFAKGDFVILEGIPTEVGQMQIERSSDGTVRKILLQCDLDYELNDRFKN